MKKFYRIVVDFENCPVSAGQVESKYIPDDQVELITKIRRVDFGLQLKKNNESETPLDSTDIWPDFLPNDHVFPILSDRLRRVMEANLNGNEGVFWIPIEIFTKTQSTSYSIFCFEKKLDVLNVQKSTFAASVVIKPVFSSTKTEQFKVFPHPSGRWKIPIGLYVDDKIKDAIESNNLQAGLIFREAEVE